MRQYRLASGKLVLVPTQWPVRAIYDNKTETGRRAHFDPNSDIRTTINEATSLDGHVRRSRPRVQSPDPPPIFQPLPAPLFLGRRCRDIYRTASERAGGGLQRDLAGRGR